MNAKSKTKTKKLKIPPVGRLITSYSMTEVGARVMMHTMVSKYNCIPVDRPKHDLKDDVWRYSYIDPSISAEKS